MVSKEDGRVIGLIELVNKEVEGDRTEAKLVRRNSEYGFSADDEKLLKMLCAHCAVFLKHLEG